MKTFAAASLSLAGLTAAGPLNKRWNPAGYDAASTTSSSNTDCYRQTYSISVSPDVSVFRNVDSNSNQTVLTSQILEYATSLPSASNFTEEYLGDKNQISETFDISGVYCEPKGGAKSDDSISLLVHGIGFDSSYWNFGGSSGVPEDYSYVYQAAEQGLATFRYDRLGTGLSDHPGDAYNVVQGPTDLAILSKVASGLRDGSLTGHAYNKIVGVGHSYGSIQCEALTANEPAALDHVVLTGYTANTSNVPLYLTSTGYSTAYNVAPERFSSNELTAAYLITVAPQTSQLNFLYYPYYSNAAAELARETEQPVTSGVLFTFGGLPGPAKEFSGKVLVVTGAKDFIFCNSNCYGVPEGSDAASIPAEVAQLYPANSGFSTIIPPNTGHGISAHYSAPATYAQINGWIAGNI